MFIYTIGLFQKKIVHGGSKKSSKFALSEGVNLLCPGGKTYCPGGQKSPCPGGKSLKIVISSTPHVQFFSGRAQSVKFPPVKTAKIGKWRLK